MKFSTEMNGMADLVYDFHQNFLKITYKITLYIKISQEIGFLLNFFMFLSFVSMSAPSVCFRDFLPGVKKQNYG